MAIFNAPNYVPDHEILAVTAAVQMKHQLGILNTSWIKTDLPPVKIRVGINSGVCLVGMYIELLLLFTMDY
jgi:class 3 adenylate cyclase